MANREYEMLFKLGARLNQNFTGTFNSAQRVLAATQKELQALNRLQSDVNGYQRQQASIEKTNDRLETYKRQLEIVRQGMNRAGSNSEDLKIKQEELEHKIRQTEQTLADKNKRLSELSKALSNAGVDVNSLASESQRLEQEMAELRTQEEAAAKEAQNFGNNSASAFEAAGSALVAAGITAGLREIYDAYKECISISMEFGGTMSTVEALSGANVKEMQELSAKAKELGASTAYTANQSAEAMTYMGMAGWNAGQMISGMDGMMALAAASGEDLGMVSDIVTDNLTAFKLEASDTAHFVDVLASAAANSNTSVGVMGETFKSSASIAGALGYSIEDVAIAVGAMANQGVKGSIAGTALKNIFNGISGEITLTSRAFGEATYTGVNLDGSMKSLSETISDLRGYFDQMTDSEKKANAQAIAGERGYNGLLAILGTTDAQYAELTADINECTGAAQKMANIKLDNLQGDVTLLQSAADGLKMSIGELYDDELRGLAQLGADILSGINEFVEENPSVVKAIIAVTAEIGLLVAGYAVYNAVKKIGNTLSMLNAALTIKETAATSAQAAATATAAGAQTALNTAMNLSPLGLVTAAIVGVTAAIGIVSAVIEDAKGNVEEFTQAAIEMNEAMETVQTDFQVSSTEMQATAATADLYIDRLAEIEAATGGNVEENEEYHNTLALLGRTIPELVDYIDLETNSIEGGTAALREYTEEWKRNAEEQARQEYINALYDEYGDVIAEAQENSIKLTQTEIKRNKLEENAANTQERMNNLWAEAEKKSNAMYESEGWTLDVTAFLTEEYEELESALIDYNAQIEICKATEDDLTEAIAVDNEMIAEAKEVINNAKDAIAEMTATELENNAAADDSSDLYETLSDAISNVKDRTEALLTAYNDAYTAAYESVSGQYSLWDKAAQVIPTSIDTINTALDTQYEYWNDYNTNLSGLLDRAGGIEGLKDVLATFSDGSEGSVNTIAGMAKATDEELKQMVDNYQKLKEEQNSVSESLADVRVDYKAEMEQITADIEEAVERMNMDEQAADAAKETILAYADAISAYKGTAVEAAEAVSAAVTGALAKASSFEVSYDTAVPAMSVPALEDILPTITGPQLRDFSGINAYANGTNNAARGWDLVGENGPELRYFNGGETVIPTARTQSILRDYGKAVDYNEAINGESAQAAIGHRAGQSETVNISISPSFVIQGSADSAKDVIDNCVEKLREMVLDVLEERERNARRSAYI